MNGFNRTAPVNEGDELEVTIVAIGDKGDGIAKKDNFVLVVPGTQVNDNVRIRVTKVLRNVGFAEVVESAGEPAEESPSEDEPKEESEQTEEEVSEEEPKETEDEIIEEKAEEEPVPEPVDSENFGEDLEEK